MIRVAFLIAWISLAGWSGEFDAVQNILDAIATPKEVTLKKPLHNPFVLRRSSRHSVSGKAAPVTPAPALPRLHLEAIVNDRAMIGGSWYCQGEAVGVYRLVEIGREQVVLRSGRETRELRLTPEEKGVVIERVKR